MATSITDTSFAGAVYAGPWWRHGGAPSIICRYQLHLHDSVPRRAAIELLSISSFDYGLYQWLQLISRQW